MRDDGRSDEEATDAGLVERARAGEQNALDELLRRHLEATWRVAFAVVGDAELAQDVVQDALIKAFRALTSFRGDSSFRTWLLTIVGNEARSALRRSGRQRESPLEYADTPASDGPDPAEMAALADEAARARAMLERLPEKQRLCVTLRIDEGLSFKEIGEIIGSSEGAARVNYFHGIRRLREWME